MTVVLACRGCCCGTDKHPEVDHDGQLLSLHRAVQGHGHVVVTPCLGHCRWSNVVVAVEPDTGEQTWFEQVLQTDDTSAVAAWLADPGRNPVPAHLVRRPPAGDLAQALFIARSTPALAAEPTGGSTH